MTGLGTDILAVACILGGAAVSGAATMAVMDGHRGHVDVACMHAAVNVSPRVVVSLDGGKGTVVMAPRVWVHRSHDCTAMTVDVNRDVSARIQKQIQEQMQQQMQQLDEELAKLDVGTGR